MAFLGIRLCFLVPFLSFPASVPPSLVTGLSQSVTKYKYDFNSVKMYKVAELCYA